MEENLTNVKNKSSDDYIEIVKNITDKANVENKSSDDSIKIFKNVIDKSNVENNSSGKTPETLMRLTDVWKIYKMGEVEFAALKNVDLEIFHGEFIAILGPSGSGKSTMMNLLGCLDLPSKGVVELNNKDISKMKESELAQIRGQLIGFIFQQFNLIPTLNTIENVMLPLEFQEADSDFSWKRAEALLEVVTLSDKKYNLPSQLSGGQRQRVAIARSLAVDPKVILADEPTGNLDSETGNYILEFLSNLHKNEGKTIIMITHDPALTKYADRVVHIRDGMVDSIEIKNSEAM
jgi:putative ABC transport system ATP-binding protein